MRSQKYMQVERRALLGVGGVLMLNAILQPARLRAQGTSPSRIGIIGSGHVGGTIGGLWVKSGHTVLFSSRHPDELRDMVMKLGSLAQAGSVEEAVAVGDVLLVGGHYGATPEAGQARSARGIGNI